MIIIENTEKGRDEFGHRYGSENFYMGQAEIDALLAGKVLATTINCDEYSIFISLRKDRADAEDAE